MVTEPSNHQVANVRQDVGEGYLEPIMRALRGPPPLKPVRPMVLNPVWLAKNPHLWELRDAP